MKLNARQRLLVLGGLLLATLAVGTWLGDNTAPSKTEVVAPSKSDSRGVAPEGASSGTPSVNLEKFQSRDSTGATRDPFATGTPPESKFGQGGAGTPGAHAPGVAALPPTAPALPFTYMGNLISGKDVIVFLSLGDRNLVVHEGDTIDALYRVEHIAKDAITLVYLPLDQRQTIVMGDPSAPPGDARVPERLSEQEGSPRGSGRQIDPQPSDPAALAIPPQSAGQIPPPGQGAPSAGPVQSQPSAGAGQSQPFTGPVPPQYVPRDGVPVQQRP